MARTVAHEMKNLLAAGAAILALAAAFMLGSYVQYSTGRPFAAGVIAAALPAAAPVPPPPIRTDVPIASTAQGAQDAARADVPMGPTIDLQRCYATMVARKLPEPEARTVCAKLIGGISH